MKPVDYRNATWDSLQGRLLGMRQRVLDALRDRGPCTTRELATAMNMDILNLRPRVTELVQLGVADVVQGGCQRHEGVYRALSLEEAQALFARRHAAANGVPVQEELALA